MSDKIGFDELRSKYKDVLSKAFATNNVDLLDSYSKSTASNYDRKSAMDQAFRDKLLELLVEEPDTLENYIGFCIEFCRRQMVTPTMPVVLLGDIFDALTLDKCEKMFTYVENGVNIWKEELFFIACKNNLLRMCNDLLRRLSRSQNTVFCGRILLFLAKFFPFSERSGLNIVSEFNLENLTEFGGDNSSNLKDALEEEMVVDTEKSKLAIDYNLYCKFWSLQDFFRNPNTCYNKLQWKTFVAHSSSVLSAFSSYKLDSVELQTSKLNRLKVPEGEGKEQHYFAKFLTNQKLLELQLSDSNFRRCVLVQFLILFQYLTSSVKFKQESHELKPEQAEWAAATAALVHRLLGETPPRGARFAAAARRVVAREEHWSQWKNDGCPEFKKPKTAGAAEGGARRRRRRPLGDVIREYEAQDKHYLGNNELTKLWNLCPDNLAACRTKERDFMPALDSYMSRGGLGDGRTRTREAAWGWRALRLLARRSPHFFIHTNNLIGRLPDYLEDMVKRITREAAAGAGAGANGDGGDGDASGDGSGDARADDKAAKQEEEEITEEQMEADLIKEADTADMEQVPDSTEGGRRARVTMISAPQLDAAAGALPAAAWRRLAAKLGFKPDDVEYIASQFDTEPRRARHMLVLWFDDDEDASVESLLYIMEGLELEEACAALRSAPAADDA